jgi:hypothetical protein
MHRNPNSTNNRRQVSALVAAPNLLAFALSGGTLLAAGITDGPASYVKQLFSLGLLGLFIGSFVLWRLRSFTLAIGSALLVVVLLVFSFMPWYGEHIGEPGELTTHRHTIWEMDGHDH